MSDLISLQIKQLKEAKHILKLWMINYIKEKKTVRERERGKEQWSIILLSPLGQMDTLKATCFQLQIIATFGLQWSALNPSARLFFFFLCTTPVISFFINNGIVFETKLLQRVIFKNKNQKESQATQASKYYTVEFAFICSRWPAFPLPLMHLLLRI